MELYKKYRPKTFEDIIGNAETVKALTNMLTVGNTPHTLLFHGPSGCGKTTLARIARKHLNCHKMDFIEINASSFRGIDSIRDVASNMLHSPISKNRIYSFDEVHKWTNDAQNAALKMLEDTPSFVYFFLCTTDPLKLIPAVRTRCCEIPVRPLSLDEMETLAKRVIKLAKLNIEEDALNQAIQTAAGSPRMMLVILDKLRNLPPKEQLEAAKAVVEEENQAIELCRALIKRAPWNDVARILKGLKADPEAIRWAVLGYAKSVLMSKPDHQAYLIIRSFETPFYDSKEAGLVAACFDAIYSKG